jgi:hypothetical protein
MRYFHIRLIFSKTTIFAQSKSSKLLKISILCNLIKVLQPRYLRHLCTLTVKAPDICSEMFHGPSVLNCEHKANILHIHK